MSPRRGPHDFVLHLRNREPFLARRLDGILGMALTGGELRLRAPEGSWGLVELERNRDRLADEAAAFFGEGTNVFLEGAQAQERLPFPVLASKTWNHAVFWVWSGRTSVALAVPKPVYLEWLEPRRLELPAALEQAGSHPRIRVFRRESPSGATELKGAGWALPDLADQLCALAREEGSYAQVVCRFPGDEEADFLEGRLYATKEWGTPNTPGPILQKYLGRLHYASPGLLGLRTAEALLEAVIGR